MNKEKYIGLVNKYFKRSNTTKKIFVEQIENFYNCKNNNINNYKVGDIVKYTKDTLIHGTRLKYSELHVIKESGLIASEFYKGLEKKKKPFIIEFFSVDEECTLKEYLDKYSNGCTVVLHDIQGNTRNEIMDYRNVFDYLKKADYRDYTIYQNQEQRFLPNIFLDKVNIAFILTYDKANPIYKYNVFDKIFDIKLSKRIFPKWYFKKYLTTRKWDNYETGREKAFVFGIPSCMIEGIIVSKKYEADDKILENIKIHFLNAIYVI